MSSPSPRSGSGANQRPVGDGPWGLRLGLGGSAFVLTVLVLVLVVLGIWEGQGKGKDRPGTASLDVSPSSLSFRNVEIGAESSTNEVTLVSTGRKAVELDEIAIDGHDREDFGADRKCSGTTLQTDQECTVSVTFTPAADRKYSAELVIDRAAGRSEIVPLSGTGVDGGTAHATLSPPDMKAIAPVGETITLRFDFENTGTAPLTVYRITLKDEDGYFTGNGDACTKHRLKPETGCSIEVFFTPASTATSEGELLIKHDAPGGTSRARLEGVGEIEETTLPRSSTTLPDP